MMMIDKFIYGFPAETFKCFIVENLFIGLLNGSDTVDHMDFDILKRSSFNCLNLS